MYYFMNLLIVYHSGFLMFSIILQKYSPIIPNEIKINPEKIEIIEIVEAHPKLTVDSRSKTF